MDGLDELGEARGMDEVEFELLGGGGGAIEDEVGLREDGVGGGGGGTIHVGAVGPVGMAGMERDVMHGTRAGLGELGVGSNLNRSWERMMNVSLERGGSGSADCPRRGEGQMDGPERLCDDGVCRPALHPPKPAEDRRRVDPAI